MLENFSSVELLFQFRKPAFHFFFWQEVSTCKLVQRRTNCSRFPVYHVSHTTLGHWAAPHSLMRIASSACLLMSLEFPCDRCVVSGIFLQGGNINWKLLCSVRHLDPLSSCQPAWIKLQFWFPSLSGSHCCTTLKVVNKVVLYDDTHYLWFSCSCVAINVWICSCSRSSS